jgi:hypothetical protein
MYPFAMVFRGISVEQKKTIAFILGGGIPVLLLTQPTLNFSAYANDFMAIFHKHCLSLILGLHNLCKN